MPHRALLLLLPAAILAIPSFTGAQTLEGKLLIRDIHALRFEKLPIAGSLMEAKIGRLELLTNNIKAEREKNTVIISVSLLTDTPPEETDKASLESQ